MAVVRKIQAEARVEALPALLDLATAGAREAGADESGQHDVRLAVEEVLMNIINHGYPPGTGGPVTLQVAAAPGSVTVTVLDEARPFAPERAPAPDLASGWESRPIGGLGWYLVHKLMDEVRHRPRDAQGNELTLRKRFGPAAAPTSTNLGSQTMQIEVERRGSLAIAKVRGNIDGLTAPELERVLGGEVSGGSANLVVAFEGVDYTSSAGLRVLLAVVKEARSRGGDVRLAGVRENVRKVLDLSGFTGILKLFPDVDAAARSFAA
jgi:anti-anti-sigma factor